MKAAISIVCFLGICAMILSLGYGVVHEDVLKRKFDYAAQRARYFIKQGKLNLNNEVILKNCMDSANYYTNLCIEYKNELDK